MEDKGVYSCRAEIIPTKYKNATAKVIVYGELNLRKNSAGCVFLYHFLKNEMHVYIFLAEHPFLNISYKNEHASTVVVTEGNKRLVFEPKVNAVPRADLTTW